MEDLQFLIQILLAGIARGSVIGLVAIGIVVIFTATRLLNFAAGEFAMIGGLAGWLLLQEPSLSRYLIGLGAAMLLGALYAVGVERIVISPLRRKGVETMPIIIALLGVSIVTAQGVQFFTGARTRAVPSPVVGPPLRIGDVFIGRHTLLTFVGVMIAVGLFIYVRQRTSLGLSLRAVGSNRQGALVIGLKPSTLESSSFALAGAVSAFAGMLITPISGWRPTMGLSVAILAFIAAIVGGISNPFAAFLGSMLIGMASVIIEVYVSPLFSTPILFVVLVIVVLVRPSGLVPSRETEEGPLRA